MRAVRAWIICAHSARSELADGRSSSSLEDLKMSPHQAVAVSVRLFAAWLGIYVLRTVASFAFVRQSDVPGFGVAVAVVVITAALVMVLWLFPGSIAKKLLSAENAKSETTGSPDLWLAMG